MTGVWKPRLKRTALWGLALVVTIAVSAGAWAGWLRWTGNVHTVEPGAVFRTAQLDPAHTGALVAELGIKTVINLRGARPGNAWYDEEVKAAGAAGATHLSFRLSARREPDEATLSALINALRTAPRPILIHCEGGADRTGLASALYELVVMGRTPEEASGQLSFRYGHFPWVFSQTAAMDRTFWRVAAATK